MSTYVLMRVLESAPRRYERGMRLLTLGRIDRAYDAIAERAGPGQRVLDLGCGTGALTRRLAARGAHVTGIDPNPGMLAAARHSIAAEGLEAGVELVEAGVADLDRLADASYDLVTAGLCLSELTEDERAYALRHVARLLRDGGAFLVADEVRPARWWARALSAVLRVPLVILTFLLTQQTTHRVAGLPERLEAAGMEVVGWHESALGTFATVEARRAEGHPT